MRAVALKATGVLGMAALMVALLLPGEAAARSVASTNWKLTAGAQSRDEAIQANAFYPRDVSVHVGDSITWTVPTGEIHTVTFLSGQPAPPLTIGGALNPAVAGPSGGSVDDGTGYFNSGLLQAATSDNPAPTTMYTLSFGEVGDYQYVCLIHSQMKGVVHVKRDQAQLPSQAEITARGRLEAGELLGRGALLEGEGLLAALLSGKDHITAGIGQLIPNKATLAIMRFLPQRQVVHVGDTVTWSNLDPETPHTVTFGTEPAVSVPPSGAGVDGPGHATLSSPGETANSGYLGAAFPFGTQFQVTFTGPGTYSYFCTLHDVLGMRATIEVR